VSNNPNKVWSDKKANCIGYSALFNSIVNHLIVQQDQERLYKARHLKGQLYFLGINVHPLFDSPFFKDHDFNEIENRMEGVKIYVDPSVSDYLGIKEIRSK